MKLNVQEVAQARGFKNAKQLADAAGLRYASVYPIWNGTARMISLDTLDSLCKTLRAQAGLLFEQVADVEAEPAPSRTKGARAPAKKPAAKK